MIDVVINGTGSLGRMVFHLLEDDDRYDVRAFTADPRWCAGDSLLGVPLLPHDDLASAWSPDDVACLSVLGGLGGWMPRRDHMEAIRSRGFRHANYVHPTAVVQRGGDWGTNNIVFPYSVIGFDGTIGEGAVLREKSYLGHEHVLGDHTFLGVGATVGGGARIGTGAYLAMSVTVSNDITIGEAAFVGIGSLVLRDLDAGGRYFGHPAVRRGDAPDGSAA